MTKMLKEEKEYSDLNYFNMKQALDYKQKHLQNKDGDMFLTADSLIELNNLILGTNNMELRKINATNPYFPWWCVESSLYILVDDFKDRRLRNRDFYDHFMEIHPFLDGNGRTCKLLFINQVIQEECVPCCLMN